MLIDPKCRCAPFSSENTVMNVGLNSVLAAGSFFFKLKPGREGLFHQLLYDEVVAGSSIALFVGLKEP